MKRLPPELFIEIFKHIRYPISLILVNKEFHQICIDPVTKSKWTLANFGRIHGLFRAVSLGKTFITVDVIKSLLALKVNYSRYFMQRLMLQYGQHNEKLIKIDKDDEFKAFQGSNKTIWLSDIPFDVFVTLLNEAEAIFTGA